MWYFRSPKIAFGEDALSELEQVQAQRAFIVTDPVMQALGFVERVQSRLQANGIACAAFAEVEPDPSLETSRR
jgi:acetaldehyde dehydrogenase/alcohol dehydrogenase